MNFLFDIVLLSICVFHRLLRGTSVTTEFIITTIRSPRQRDTESSPSDGVVCGWSHVAAGDATGGAMVVDGHQDDTPHCAKRTFSGNYKSNKCVAYYSGPLSYASQRYYVVHCTVSHTRSIHSRPTPSRHDRRVEASSPPICPTRPMWNERVHSRPMACPQLWCSHQRMPALRNGGGVQRPL